MTPTPEAYENRVGSELVPVSAPALPEPISSDPGDIRLSDVDEWGRSENVRRVVREVFGPLYRQWFRAEWEGLEKIPSDGGALLVANHGGALPIDAAIVMHGIEEQLGRAVYGLAENLFRRLPVIGTLWARAGGVAANPDNAYRLLRQHRQLVLTFPEGTKATAKPYSERYQLQRFGRGGFVEIAMRAGVPVIPIAIIGNEESMPSLLDIGPLAHALRLPYVPITVNHLLFGPVVGTVLHLPAKFRLRVLDPVRFDVEPDETRYPSSLVLEHTESIREQLQVNLHDMLSRRQSVWFG